MLEGVSQNFSFLFLGMVYNVTPYMDYHPGGEEELMKAAGIDGTDLFDQVWEVLEEVKSQSLSCYLLKCHFSKVSTESPSWTRIMTEKRQS